MIAYVRNLDIISTYLLFNIVQQSLRVTRHIALDSVTVFVFISVDSADVMISHNATNLFSSNHFSLLIIINHSGQYHNHVLVRLSGASSEPHVSNPLLSVFVLHGEPSQRLPLDISNRFHRFHHSKAVNFALETSDFLYCDHLATPFHQFIVLLYTVFRKSQALFAVNQKILL